MIVGFTGTRQGMTGLQRDNLSKLLDGLGDLVHEFHHGDCVGADSQAHDAACKRSIQIVIHPGNDPKTRAWRDSDRVAHPRPMLSRNRDIVDASDLLIAAPNTPERLHSGTWSTIRYAIRRGVRYYILHPDGSLTTTNTQEDLNAKHSD